jgi:hypothetical protein
MFHHRARNQHGDNTEPTDQIAFPARNVVHLHHAFPDRFTMTPGARLSAAIEGLADIEDRRRPAGDALKDWGLAHRFAGSGDRAAIGGLVFDARGATVRWCG